jgi:hypothetical protein
MIAFSRFPRIAWPENNRRTLAIWGAGAVIGLVAAGLSLFTAKGTATSRVAPDYVATVNQRALYASDFIAQLQTQFNVSLDQATPQQRKAVLEQMIREELFVQRGLELDEPEIDIEVRNALAAAVQATVAVDATSQTPTEAELKAFDEQNTSRYLSIGEMAVKDLVPVAAAAAAPEARDRLTQASAALNAGRALPAVEAQFGLKESGAVTGAEYYFAAKIHLGDRLFAVAQSLTAGQVSPPVQAGDGGWHLLVMVSNARPVARDFAQAHIQVYDDYRAGLIRRIQDNEFKYLRGKADIRINPAYGR